MKDIFLEHGLKAFVFLILTMIIATLFFVSDNDKSIRAANRVSYKDCQEINATHIAVNCISLVYEQTIKACPGFYIPEEKEKCVKRDFPVFQAQLAQAKKGFTSVWIFFLLEILLAMYSICGRILTL